jgi:hypothetical protein
MVEVMVIAVAAVAATGVLAQVLRRRRPRTPHSTDFGPVRPAVRLLTTDEELRAAVDRAVAGERAAAARYSQRIDRYSRLASIRPSEREGVTGDATIIAMESSIGSIEAIEPIEARRSRLAP